MPRINVQTPIFFKCQTGCSSCCSSNGGTVSVTYDDIKRISVYLKISSDEFEKKYIHQDGSKTALVDKNESECVFLEEHKCRIYPVRPRQCKTFPFWPQNLKSEKRWNMIMDECPGIGDGKAFSRREIEEIFKGKPVNSKK